MSDRQVNDKLSQVESALRRLAPATDFNRDRLLFRAGQVAAKPRLWTAAAIAGVVGILVGFLPAFFVLRMNRPAATRIVYVPIDKKVSPRPEPPITPRQKPRSKPKESPSMPQAEETTWYTGLFEGTPMSSSNYIGMRNQALRWGVDALPSPQATSGAAKANPQTFSQVYLRGPVELSDSLNEDSR